MGWLRRAFRKRTMSGMFRGILTMSLGTALARLVSIAFIPVLTRIYAPEDFGVMSVFNALILVLLPLITLRFPMALPLPRTRTMAANLLAVSLATILATSLGLSILLFFFGPPLLRLFSIEALLPHAWLVPLAALSLALFDSFSMWATRLRDYRLLAQAQLQQALTGESLKLALGLMQIRPAGLLIGQIFSQSSGSLLYLWRYGRALPGMLARCNRPRMRAAARRFSDFPLYRMPAQFLLVLAIQAPLLFVSSHFGLGPAGQLGLALMALALPFNIVGQSMSRAYYAEISKLGRRQPARIRDLTGTLIRPMLLFSLPATAGLFLLGEPLFALILGPEWALAGRALSVLSLTLALQFVSSAMVELFSLYNEQWRYLWLLAGRLVLIALALGIVVLFGLGFMAMIWLVTLAVSLHFASIIVVARRLLLRRIAARAAPSRP